MTNLLKTSHYFRVYVSDIKLASKANKCDITGKTKNLVVHHMNISYIELLREAFERAGVEYTSRMKGLTPRQIENIGNELVKVHREKVKFVTLSYDLHEKYHSLNQNDVTEEQYKLFKENVKKTNREKQRRYKYGVSRMD